jgi:sugar (pentulose or hexulose) kinase
MNEYLLSVDIGTESGRAALLTLDGEVAASSSREYPLYCPKAEWAEQDVNRLFINTLRFCMT